jgi:hypothetical protein
MRFYGLVRPFVFVAGAYAMSLGFAHLCSRWRTADRRAVVVASFIAGVLGASALRFGCQAAELMTDQARQNASYKATGTEPLVAWAREQMAASGPDRFARALFTDTEAYYAHVTALTGLPAFHAGPIPTVMLRERIDDLDPESLRRFNVRWEITEEPSAKLTVGDPSTEQLVGKYRIREVPTWDGQFARIERGSGRVRVTRLDDDAVDVELLDTSEPALVALGTGYHPRWRATADGTPVPVYALPATSRSRTHVVAAWLRPGTTRFTPDGPLPSDGAGRMLSLLGLFAAA